MKRHTAILSVSALAIASAVAAAVYVPSPGLSEAQEAELDGYSRRPNPHPQGYIVIDQDWMDRNPDNGVSDGGFPETN